jgi:hypothetical protein
MVLEGVPNALGEGTQGAVTGVSQQFLGDPAILAAGIGLIIVAAIVFYYVKQIIVNSLLGIVAWAVLSYGLNVQLPFWASLIVSIIFGLAGVGVMLVLRFLGIL